MGTLTKLQLQASIAAVLAASVLVKFHDQLGARRSNEVPPNLCLKLFCANANDALACSVS